MQGILKMSRNVPTHIRVRFEGNLATKSTERWASNLAGRNACEARAGLERPHVDADPALKRGRPSPSGRTGAGTRKPITIGTDGATGVVSQHVKKVVCGQ